MWPSVSRSRFSIKKHTVMPAGPSRPPATRRDTFTSQRFSRCQLESGHRDQSTSLFVSYFLISTCVLSLSHGIKNGTFCAHLPDEREDGAHFPSLLTVGLSPWFVLLELHRQPWLAAGRELPQREWRKQQQRDEAAKK